MENERTCPPSIAKQMGVSGTFYMRTWEGGKEKWKAIGSDPSQARMAVVRKERDHPGLMDGIVNRYGKRIHFNE